MGNGPRHETTLPDGTVRFDGPNKPNPNKPDTADQYNNGQFWDSPLGKTFSGAGDWFMGLIESFNGGGVQGFLNGTYGVDNDTVKSYKHPEPWEIEDTGTVTMLPTMMASEYFASNAARETSHKNAPDIRVKSVEIAEGKRTFHFTADNVEGTLEKEGASFSFLNNNPGNLTADNKYAAFFGAAKKPDGTLLTDDHGYVVFPRVQDGVLAQLCTLRDMPGNPTLRDTILKHLPITDGKDKEHYVKRVAELSGIHPETKIDDMTGEELGRFAGATTRVEGFNPELVTITKGKLPAGTKDYIFESQGIAPEELPKASPLQTQFGLGGVADTSGTPLPARPITPNYAEPLEITRPASP